MREIAFLLAVIVGIEVGLCASRGLARFVLAAVPLVFSLGLLYLLCGKYKRRVDTARAAAADAAAAATAAAAVVATAAADARARGYVFDAPVAASTPIAAPATTRAPTRVEILWFVQCISLIIVTLVDCLRIASKWQSLQGFSLCPCTLAAALLTSVAIEWVGDWVGF